MALDRRYLVWALVYVAVGAGLGIFMAASSVHAQYSTHGHILLVGFLLSLAYGVIHRLWLDAAATRVAHLQFVLHQAGAAVMSLGLFLLYGGMASQAQLNPVLGAASLAVAAAALLMLWMVLRQ